jgi:hypothetical protein
MRSVRSLIAPATDTVLVGHWPIALSVDRRPILATLSLCGTTTRRRCKRLAAACVHLEPIHLSNSSRRVQNRRSGRRCSSSGSNCHSASHSYTERSRSGRHGIPRANRNSSPRCTPLCCQLRPHHRSLMRRVQVPESNPRNPHPRRDRHHSCRCILRRFPLSEWSRSSPGSAGCTRSSRSPDARP